MQSKRAYQATVAPETKFVDTGFTYTAQTATPTFTLMNPLVQGTTNGTRIGNKVQCRGLEVRAAVGLPAAPDNNTTMRVGIVVDFQSNGVVPTVGEIWNNGAAAPNVFASRNLNYIERFKILKDNLVSLSLAGPGVQNLIWHLPADVVTKYIGNTGGVADIETGAIYFYSFSDEAVGPTNPLLAVTARYKFIDP
ncbi:hypothetical protein WUBG_16896 [Wuchereria bancrofti]|uniref:Uncharacterized protein n=1 Tax=Wuchereria bancrofti TaxID=6293 RepID=J9DRH9_WUCBA|nr:hypothetical protein WUBG_16896 [Wuchereria bancrofti]